MFCGSGKSLLILDSFLRHGENLTLLVFPSIPLITQFNLDYLLSEKGKSYHQEHYPKKKYQHLTICSKDEVSDNITNLQYSTEEDDIIDFLEQEKDKLVLVTYSSFPMLYQILEDNEIEVDLVCFDEAHHCGSDTMKPLLFHQVDSVFEMMLFFTATPKNYNGVKLYRLPHELDEIDLANDENSSMDVDEPHCGELLYEYFHHQGVKDRYLNDFQIRVDLSTDTKDKRLYSNLEAIARAVLATGNNRVLTFHSRTEVEHKTHSNVLEFVKKANKQFPKIFKKIRDAEFPGNEQFNRFQIKGITAKTKNRKKLLHKFDKTPDNEIFILASCKTIGEGVDTEKANMAVFIDPKQSYVDIIQNIGRICRKQANYSTILIPCLVDKNKYSEKQTDEERDKVIREDMGKKGNFNGILNVLSALRQEDPHYFELCLKYPKTYSPEEVKDEYHRIGYDIDLENEMELSEALEETDDFVYQKDQSEEENLKTYAEENKKQVQILSEDILDDVKVYGDEEDEKVHLFQKKNGKYCHAKPKNKSVSGNANVRKPNRNQIKPLVHTNPDVRVLWRITNDIEGGDKIQAGYLEATIKEYNWDKRLDELKDYIDEHCQRPSSRSKKKQIKSLGYWVTNQLKNYPQQKQIMQNKEIRKKWEIFIEDEKYQQYFIVIINREEQFSDIKI